MKKLRNILQSKYLILLLVLITTLIVLLETNKVNFKINRIGDNKTFSGMITNISINEYSQVLKIKDTVIYVDLKYNFMLGQKVECIGLISLPKQNTNFYLFNYRNFLKSKKIFYQMEAECNVINEEISLLYKIKNEIIKRIDNFKSRGYLKAFILGNTNDIDSDIMSSYRDNGISHLLAISGMHVTFLVGVLSFIKRKYLIISILILYLFLANFPISMMRAVVFFILLKINKKIYLNISSVNLFIYFTISILCYNPYLIYNLGFIYSFVISFYLILFSNTLKNKKNKILSILMLPIVIFLVTIPINIQNNFYLNLLSPINNIIFVPLVSIILFPMSFIVLIFPIFDKGYYFLWNIIEYISLNFLNYFSLNIIFAHISFSAFIGYYVIITFILYKMSNNEYRYIGILILILTFHYFLPFFRNDGIIQMLDVGQGDSILISYPNNKLNILIDVGGKTYSNSTNIVKNITIPTLYSLGITKLDYLILSHGDFDHAGETINLLKEIKVNMVLFNTGNLTELEESIIEYLNNNKINYSFISEKIINYNNIELYFLNSTNKDNENEDSIVLLLKIKNFTSLFMGDSGFSTEKEILEEYNLPHVDILKVGHHGSKNSSSIEFINHINPTTALISAGNNNIYNHPHKDVLNNLQFCDTYITSIHGAIKITIDDDMLVTMVR